MNYQHALLASSLLIYSLSTPTQADFCNGKRFGFIDMDTPERILNARDAVLSEQEALEEARLYRYTDQEANERQMNVQLNARHTRLLDDTLTLCKDWKSHVSWPIHYQSIPLSNGDEVRTQLRLNLAEFLAQHHALEWLDQRRATLSKFDKRLDAQGHELRLALRHLDALSASPGPEAAERVIGQSCNSLDRSSELRKSMQPLALNQLIAELRAPALATGSTLDALLSRCELNSLAVNPRPTEGQGLNNDRSWWRFW